jgi:hypothetical protein
VSYTQPIRQAQLAPQAVAPPKAAYLSPPPAMANPQSIQQQKVVRPTSPTGALSVNAPIFAPRAVTPSPIPADLLLAFLKENKDCVKGSPEAFFRWLGTQDITTREDLADAVSDDDYQDVLQKGDGKVGVKGFKRAAFKKAIMARPGESNSDTPPSVKNDLDDDFKKELICPISHMLMTDDPVLAADGHTYERAQIAAWFRKQQKQIEDAKRAIVSGSDSQQARAIIERGVLSPLSHEKMTSLNLVPNNAVRTMAKDASAASNQVRFE